jgi:ADP-heptose:LPS heptosyltransferase
MRLPPICLDHEYFLGDTVLLEALASYLAQYHEAVSVSSDYPEIFENNPAVRGISREEDIPESTKLVDMSPSVRGIIGHGEDTEVVKNKLQGMCDVLGIKKRYLSSPKIYLSQSEMDVAEDVRQRFPGRRIGVAVETSMAVKNWPAMERFVKQQAEKNQHVCLFCKEKSPNMETLCEYAVIPFYDQPLREKIAYISAMDVMVGPDTGLMHMAAALGVPIIVIGFDWFEEIYDLYDNCDYIKVPMLESGMKWCSARRINRRLRKVLNRPPVSPDVVAAPAVRKAVRSDIAIFRLDGMGGTLTVADQAKKIHEATGVKPDLIIRGYADLFKNNPHVNAVTEVGHVVWGECMDVMKKRYDTIAEIRFAPAKWHQRNKVWFDQEFGPVQELFDDFPMHYNRLEIHKKHQVQLTDWYLGLPDDTIDMELFDVHAFDGLPDTYLLINNGVDVIHKGMRQTKTWSRWAELVKIMPIPTVQCGTANDPLIPGVIDVRGKYKLNQLPYIIQKATVCAFTEGGLMHLSYAAGNPNTFILRGPTCGKLFEYPGQHMIDSYVCYNCWYSTADWYQQCPKGIDAVCMKSITPERVAMRLEEAIA